MRVLFVCLENACRSQMAEAFANMLGAEGVEAYSAGLEPGETVDGRAVEVMCELGYDLARHASKSVDDLPDIEFDYVITMGCGEESPVVKARMQIDWDVPDPSGMGLKDFRQVRDAIRERVERLLAAPRVAID